MGVNGLMRYVREKILPNVPYEDLRGKVLLVDGNSMLMTCWTKACEPRDEKTTEVMV